MVDEPAADHGDPHVSPSLSFVGVVRLKNLAQNHFRNVSASCASHPCSSLLKAPAPWPRSEVRRTVRRHCLRGVHALHAQRVQHARVTGCAPRARTVPHRGCAQGRGRRWNSGARFTLPLRGHSPGPSGLGGVYLPKLLRANIFQSTAGQGPVRSIAGSSWRDACHGVVHTALGCSSTGFRTPRSEAFESPAGVREQ